MTDLSPQALVVWNAYLDKSEEVVSNPWEVSQCELNAVAAALEAAADQVVPDESHPELSQFWDDEADREWQNNQQIRRQLLAIAAELRGQDQQHTEEN